MAGGMVYLRCLQIAGKHMQGAEQTNDRILTQAHSRTPFCKHRSKAVNVSPCRPPNIKHALATVMPVAWWLRDCG